MPKLRGKPIPQGLESIAWSHQQAAMSAFSGQDQHIHQLLMSQPLPRLEQVYRYIFEKVLNERISKAGPRLAEASQRLEYAKENGRPLLFVFYEGDSFTPPPLHPLTQQILRRYVVVAMPLREAPALSHLTGQPPFSFPRSSGASSSRRTATVNKSLPPRAGIRSP